MKKVTASAVSIAAFLLSASKAFALTINPPSMGIPGTTNVGTVIGSALTIAYIVGALAVLFYLVIGAFKWITSGGDKDAVGKARATITHALIGLAILALAWLIVVVVGAILKIDLTNFTVPTLTGENSNI